MGYVVLWLENLAAVLLLTATVVACCSRWKHPIFRIGLPVLAVLLILAGYGGLTAIVGILRRRYVASQWLLPVAAPDFPLGRRHCGSSSGGCCRAGMTRPRRWRPIGRAASWPWQWRWCWACT